jgi:hypothetical protein
VQNRGAIARGWTWGLMVILCLADSGLAQEHKTRVVWKGVSGGYQWQWTAHGITAKTLQGHPVLTLHDTDETAQDEPKTRVAMTYTPLSLVGSLLSYSQEDYMEGGAHPTGGTRYVTIDAARPKHPLKLTDLFADADVLRALLADAVVQRVRRQENITNVPTTSADLIQQLTGQTFTDAEDNVYGFAANLLENFAFHHLENNTVAIRLCVAHGTELSRFHYTQLGLLLPIPDRLRNDLQRAMKRQVGFLMRDATSMGRHPTMQR